MTQVANGNAGVVVEQLRSWKAQAVVQVIEHRGETTIVVPPDMLRAVAQQCRDNPALNFNLLSDATCIDRFPIEPRFELNYQLVSIPRRARIRLRTSVTSQHAVIHSLVPIWEGANWMEREIFDLFGVHFNDHPDLRRILLPEGFEGFPLRRNFPVEGKR